MHIAQVSSLLPSNIRNKAFNDYELVVFAGAEVEDKVKDIQRNLRDQYGQIVATYSRPYISVAAFKAREAMEETMIRYIHRVCKGQTSFFVELNNIGGYPPKDMFLRVQNPLPFRQLGNNLKPIHDYIHSCSCPLVLGTLHPHINIISAMPETLYLAALLEYGQMSFYETFKVSELYLLRKDKTRNEQKVINVFGLQPAAQPSYN